MTNEERREHKIQLVVCLDGALQEAIILNLDPPAMSDILAFATNRSGTEEWSECITAALDRTGVTEDYEAIMRELRK
jgi:hypothetical protein